MSQGRELSSQWEFYRRKRRRSVIPLNYKTFSKNAIGRHRTKNFIWLVACTMVALVVVAAVSGGWGGGHNTMIRNSSFLTIPSVVANFDYQDYVREILREAEEEERAYRDENSYHFNDDEHASRDQKETEEKEAENLRRAQEREASFEKRIQKLSRQEQKKARKKKKRDAKLVATLLQAAERGDYYAVLGLHQKQKMSQFMPPWLRGFIQRISEAVGKKGKGGGGGFFQVTSSDIRRAYRSMAAQIHPDKNSDGRAEQAFVALDEAYNFLSNPQQRKAYDVTWMDEFASSSSGSDSSNWAMGSSSRLAHTLHGARRVVTKTTGVMRKVVGPFAVPASILAIVFL